MDRRNFIGLLGGIAVVTSVMPFAKLLPETDVDYYWRKRNEIPIEKQNDLVGGWVSYKVKYTVTLPPHRALRYTMKNCPRREVYERS